MLGVLKRRWKPKRASNTTSRRSSLNKTDPPLPNDAATDKNRTASSPHQIHPLCDDKTQYLAYDTLSLNQPSADAPLYHPPPLPILPPYANPLVANICVEGGRIEFVKTPPDYGHDQKTVCTLEHAKTISRAQQTCCQEEKSDLVKERLEARVLDLEQALEREQSNGIRERLALARAQRQLARREVHQRDVDRERRLRLDTEGRLRETTSEADNHRTRLSTLQGELSRMEETVRSMLQYKARSEQLKQEKTTLTVAYESRIHQFQNTVTKLNQENDALRQQLRHCEASDETESQSALLERLQALETDNCELAREAEQQRRQYERCLDDVANKVVRALMSQKGLREEITGLQRRIVELEAQNRALTSVLVQQFQDGGDARRAGSRGNVNDKRHSLEPLTSDMMTPSGFSPDTPGTSISTPSTSDIAEEHALMKTRMRNHQVISKLWDDSAISSSTSAVLSLTGIDPVLWLPLPRPRSLNLTSSLTMALAATPSLGKVKRRLSNGEKPLEDGDSPGNRDEGYSTMSSDVQDPLRPDPVPSAARGLEDLKEETDVGTVAIATPASNKLIVVEDSGDPDIVYIPLSMALGLGRNRHSFPPSRNILPFQHIIRSFSDSHLCLKFTSPPRYDGNSSYSVSSATSSSPSILVLSSGDQKQNHPLRRTKGVNVLTTAFEGDENEDANSNSGSWCSSGELVVEGCWWDADYVQHWLKLDDSRTTLQQQHRDRMEYDQTELEDWSMSLSSEDIAHEYWRKPGSVVETLTPGMLPSIQEHNAMELEEDANECLWNNASYLMDRPGGELMTLLLEGEAGGMNIDTRCWPYGGSGENIASNFCLASPGGSWSSTGTSSDCCHSYDCSYNCQAYDSKRSSAALSDDATEPHAVGTDFTRDFYRLVKFESTKSLASTSSRSQAGDQGSLTRRLALDQAALPRGQEREQALQSVLHFIAEQQQYCVSREEEDSGKEFTHSRPSSYIQDDRGESDSFTKQLNAVECVSCSYPIHEMNSSQEETRLTETSPITECLHNNSLTSDASTCVASPSHVSRDNAVRENGTHDPEGDDSSESDGSDKPAETQICTIIQVQTQDVSAQTYRQENEIQHASNNSGKLVEVFLNEENIFAKHLQSNPYFGDMKGLFVSPDYHQFVSELGVRDAASDCDETAEEIGSSDRYSTLAERPQEHTQDCQVVRDLDKSASQFSEQEDSLVTKPDEIPSKACTKSFEGSFEKCKIKSALPPLAVDQRSSFMPTSSRITDVLVTVIEETEDDQLCSSESRSYSRSEFRDIVESGGSVIVNDHPRPSSFHERATSKDVIEELNRMIRKGEDGAEGEVSGAVGTSRSRLDTACCCPTGWVHVERDIDFTDPKARANLLDVMLASSDSSVGSSSSDSGDEPADYQRLHRLHRFRRQKKASATRDQLGVLRCPAGISRPSIIGRDDFFVRYGDKERDAVASFDFLEDLSTTSLSGSDAKPCATLPQDVATPASEDSDERTGSGGQISLSDSCAASYSGSAASLENQA